MKLEGLIIKDRKNDTLLFAESLKVNITDWFFFRDNIVLKYIGLDNALIHLKRKDPTWNYQFLIDYFSSPSKKADTSKNVIKLDLKTISLNNVRLIQEDKWTGENMEASVGHLTFEADVVEMKKKILQIKYINLENPYFAQYDYQGLRPSTKHTKSNINLNTHIGLQWNTDNWTIKINKIDIAKGKIAIEQYTSRPISKDLFDNEHIIFNDLFGQFKNLSVIGDTIRANASIKTRNPSGFLIKDLSAVFRFTPEIMEFNNLNLLTNKSHLSNYYSMSYKDFNKDMNNFISNVNLKGVFKNSEISSDDIAYFAPELKNWKRTFSINGYAFGTIDNLHANNVHISSGNTVYAGDISMKGLPDIDKTLFNINANQFKTNISDISVFIPQLRSINTPNLKALGNIDFHGTFIGFLNKFSEKSILSSNLGTIISDLKIATPHNAQPTYVGTVSANKFNLGKFIDQQLLGPVTFSGMVDGHGFDNKTMSLKVNGEIKNIFFNDYNYSNILADGILQNRSFTGKAILKDNNVKIPFASGSIDFSKPMPVIKMDAIVDYLNLKNLKLTNDDISFTGKLNVDFTGNNLDNFLGNARIFNATLYDKNQKLSFDSLIVKNFISEKVKHLTIQSNEIDATLTGNFQLNQLREAFQLFLNKYYPAYIPNVNRSLHPQDFSFDIKTRNIDEYIALIDKRLKGFNNSSISGDLNLATNHLTFNATVPVFSLGKTTFNVVDVIAIGGKDSLTLSSNIGEISINDSLKFPTTKINLVAHNDISDISIKTSANQALNEADLSVRLQTLKDGFNVLFNPSSFVLNNKKWILQKGGMLSLNKSNFTASQVKFTQDDQQLIISTVPSSNGSNDVAINLQKLNIGDISPFILKSPRLEGLLTGDIKIVDPFNDPTAIYNTKVEQFRLDNDSIGIIKLEGIYSSKEKSISGKVLSDNSLLNLSSDVVINLKDSIQNQLNIVNVINNADVHVLEKYLSFLFTNMHGVANGNLSISGTFKQPRLNGKILLDKTSFIVDYTKAKYFLADGSSLIFKDDEIDIPKVMLHDSLNHVASVTGKMYHKFFNDFYFDDLSFITDHFANGQPGKLLLLNTTSKDNKDFYGHLVGDAHLSLNGPEDDMTMSIIGEPTDSSHIYLPTGETAETGKINYIDFIKFGREMKNDFVFRKQSNIKVNIDIDANPYAKIDVILDDVTGDVIKAQGTGKLNISVGTRDPLIIRGRYDILQGEYTFNFQTFFKTPFTLQQGSIEWQGDPYLANLNIDAIYKARKVDMSGIVSSNGFTNTKGDIDILFKLRGTLKEPKPDFEFQFAFDNPLKSDPIANEYIRTKFQGDRNTLNKEVTALLLFNSIITDQQNLLSGNNTGNFVTRSLGQVISNTLSSSLNNILKKVLKTDAVNLYTNINTADFNFQNTQKTVQNVGNFGLRTAFLKNRLQVNVGGNVDYNLQRLTTTNSNFLFTPDVSFEYYITPDGKFKVVGFNRIDAALGDLSGITRRNRTGLLVSYHRDFNTFNELFGIVPRNDISIKRPSSN